MPINDNSPERKNLIILAMSIILFYLGGGSLSDNSIKLQIINVHFSNPEILIKFVWGLLIWFVYRYWLVMQKSWVEPFHKELESSSICRKILHRHLIKRFNISINNPKERDNHRFLLFQYNNFEAKITFTHLENHTTKNTIHDLKLSDRLYIFVCALYLLFRKPSLSTYFLPYVLSAYALYLGFGAL